MAQEFCVEFEIHRAKKGRVSSNMSEEAYVASNGEVSVTAVPPSFCEFWLLYCR